MIWNKRIKELREERGLTLLDVSKRLGISESTAQRYESEKGIKNIPYDSIVGYAKVLGVTPSYLMGWDPSPAAAPPLSGDARRLLDAFDRLNTRGRSKVLEYASDLAESDRYKKDTASPEEEAM